MAECEVNNTEEEEEKSCELYLEKDQEEIVEEVVDDAQSACKAFIILASPQKCELEQEVQSLFINGACHENQEADWNFPPKFDEHEEQEEEMERSTVKEPPKEGDVSLTFLEPTLKAEPSEFTDLKEMILHRPALDTQNRTPSHPLAKPILQESSHVFLKDIPHDIPPKITPQPHLDLIPKAIQPNKHQKEAMFQQREYGVGAFHDSMLKPYFGDNKIENLRANSFLEGENDVSMGGLFDPNNNSPNKEESKAKNGLIKAPWTVFDPGKDQL